MARRTVIFIPRGHLVHVRDLKTGDLWVINPGEEDIGAHMESMNMPQRVQYEVYDYLDMPIQALGAAFRETGGLAAAAFRNFLDKSRPKDEK